MAQLSRNSPIGIFDSGIGGLTVAGELAKTLPAEKFIYIGDNANFPYGTRDAYDIQRSVVQIGTWLQNRGCKLIIIACNTATAAGLEVAQNSLNIPVVGVIKPGAVTAASTSKNRNIGILATRATINSHAYKQAIKAIDPGFSVVEVAAQMFVDIAENQLPACAQYNDGADGKYPAEVQDPLEEIAAEYCKPIIKHNCDTVILGCTHFPFLKPAIEAVLPQVNLVSPSAECILGAKKILEGQNLLNDGVPEFASNKFYTTGNSTDKFIEFGKKVFSVNSLQVNHLEL